MARRRRRRKIGSKGGVTILAVLVTALVIAYTILMMIAEAIDNSISYVRSLSLLNKILLVFVIIVIWFLVIKISAYKRKKKQEYKRRILEEQQLEEKRKLLQSKSLDILKQMDPYEFEHYIARVFKYAGFRCEVTKQTGDGGKDIILHAEDGVRLVECKRYTTTKVRRPDIQKFHSAIIETNAKEGFFITTGEFTKQARECAKDKPIHTINGEKLMDLIGEYMELETEVLG